MRLPRPSLSWISLALGMAILGVLIFYVLDRQESASERLDQARADRDTFAAELAEQEAASTALAEQIESLGKKPVVDPEELPEEAEEIVGEMGPRGLPGLPGEDGKPGKPGPRGPVGPVGPEGEDGSNGTSGTDGLSGEDGSDGTDGQQGPAGPPGSKGEAGPKGDKGERGEKGEQGPAGPQGEPGPAGPPGPAGTIVETYDDCPAGQYVSAVHISANGTLSVRCSNLPTLPGNGNAE